MRSALFPHKASGVSCASSLPPAQSRSVHLHRLLLTAIGVVALGGCAEICDDDYRVPLAAERARRIPVPDRALLSSPHEPDCEGKPAASGDSPKPNADAALRTKLENDKECYRKAEIKAREQLKRLQASTAKMIEAARRLEQVDR